MTSKLAPHLERPPRRETTREVMLRSVDTPGGVRLWWAAALTAGVGPQLLDALLELSKAPPFADRKKAFQAMLKRAR